MSVICDSLLPFPLARDDRIARGRIKARAGCNAKYNKASEEKKLEQGVLALALLRRAYLYADS
jgi:hypothetical protein